MRACLGQNSFDFYTCKRRPSERACILTICACAEQWSLPWLRLLMQLSPPLLLVAAAAAVEVVLMQVTAQGTPLSVQMKMDGSLLAASGRSELLLLLQMVLVLLLHQLLLPHRLKFFFQPIYPIYPISLLQQQQLLLLLMPQRPLSIQLLLPLPPLSC